MIEFKPEPIRCNRCSKPVNESDPLDFGGGLACMPCIREHYRESYRKSYDGKMPGSKRFERDFEAFIQEELVYRRRTGPRVLKEILRQRAKEQRKQERRWRY